MRPDGTLIHYDGQPVVGTNGFPVRLADVLPWAHPRGGFVAPDGTVLDAWYLFTHQYTCGHALTRVTARCDLPQFSLRRSMCSCRRPVTLSVSVVRVQWRNVLRDGKDGARRQGRSAQRHVIGTCAYNCPVHWKGLSRKSGVEGCVISLKTRDLNYDAGQKKFQR